jgi:endonuclease/exonuclease/phosphatase family metal-dependent hydrolase
VARRARTRARQHTRQAAGDGSLVVKPRRRLTPGRIIARVIIVVIVLLLVVAGGFLALATAMEYRPSETERLTLGKPTAGSEIRKVAAGDSVSVLTFNIGYGGLGKSEDFFMDGGQMITPPAKAVETNLAGIAAALQAHPVDAVLLQEVDTSSKRSHGHDEAGAIREALPGFASAFAFNFRSTYTPYPWPPIGKVDSGLMTLTRFKASLAERVSLPVPFDWPVRLFNLKRCLLIERIPVDGGEELILINLHLEAYADDSARDSQMEVLRDIARREYGKGNYVVIAGDFNQTFPGARFPARSTNWVPGILAESAMPDGWTITTDVKVATSRLNDKPWDGTNQLYAIDGFIVSPNVEITEVATVDLGFEHSDHNPVKATLTLTK